MKIIDKRKALQDPYIAKNFRREAKLLQMVRHSSILQLYEVIETDSSLYLITELCSGIVSYRSAISLPAHAYTRLRGSHQYSLRLQLIVRGCSNKTMDVDLAIACIDTQSPSYRASLVSSKSMHCRELPQHNLCGCNKYSHS